MGLRTGMLKLLGRSRPAAAAPERDERSAAADRIDAPRGLSATYASARARAHPDDPRAWQAIGETLAQWCRYDEALDAFRRAGVDFRRSEDGALAYAEAAERSDRSDEATDVLRSALSADEPMAKARARLVRLLLASRRIDEARSVAEGLRSAGGTDAVVHELLARCERRAGRLDDAERRARASLEARPGDARAWALLSAILLDRDSVDEAMEAIDEAIASASPAEAMDFLPTRVEILRRRGDFAGMVVALADGLRERPDPAWHFMLAEALLVQGRFGDGWREFEFRKFEPSVLAGRPAYDAPAWAGQPLDGKTVLVEAEQGIGDVVLFARFLPALERLGARVVVIPREDMIDVTRRFAGTHRVLASGEILPPLDFHVRLASLPHLLGDRAMALAARAPYLHADAARSARWKSLVPDDGRLRVGIVWAGRPDQPRDRFRSTALQQWLPLLRLSDIRCFSLQKGAAEAQIADLPPDVRVDALGPLFEDLDDLVAAIDRMDLVVSVCTGPAHLAGALGKPVWIVVSEPPDMRWMIGRDDSPWYPTMRIFRQPARGDWDAVIADVADRLSRLRDGRCSTDPDSRGDAGDPSSWRESAEPPWPADRILETRDALLIVPSDARDAPPLPRGDGIWLPRMLALALRCTSVGTVLIESASGAGLHAVSLARKAGPSGLVFAYEADIRVRRALSVNLRNERSGRATVMVRTLGGPSPAGFGDERETVDDLHLDRLDGIKVNDGADSEAIVEGASDTLWRCRPWLILVVDDDGMLARLGARVREFGYRTWRLETPLHSSDSMNRREAGIVGSRNVLALVAFPEEADLHEPLADCVELR